MLGPLKKILAECHLNKDDRVFKILADAEPAYLIQRANEELAAAKVEPTFEEAERRLKMSIQLINLARYKLRAANATNSTNSGNESSSKRRRRSVDKPSV